RQLARHEAERALQAADLRDVPGRPRRDVAHPLLRRGASLVGLGLSASRQRLAQLASGDRAADAAPVAGDAPQANSRQCRGALSARRIVKAAAISTRRNAPMAIIDSQVHVYEANTPKRPWHSVPNWPDHVTGDEMVAAMDRVGVDGAIFISAFSMYRY